MKFSSHTLSFYETFNSWHPLSQRIGRPNIEQIYVGNLLVTAGRRRTNQGHVGITLDAARLTVDFLRNIFVEYETRANPNFNPANVDYDGIAEDMAAYYPTLHRIQAKTIEMLALQRDEIFSDTSLTRSDPNLSVRALKSNIPEIQNIIEELNKEFVVHYMDTFNFALNYIEVYERNRDYKTWFALKSKILSCVNTHIALFGNYH